MQQTKLFVILEHFCPFTSITTQKIKILKKCIWRYHHFIYVNQKLWSDNEWFLRIRDGAWQTDRWSCYFSIWAIFSPFTPLTTKKIKILKNLKKSLEICHFTNFTSVYQKFDQRMQSSWDTVHDGRCNYFSFWPLFALLLP